LIAAFLDAKMDSTRIKSIPLYFAHHVTRAAVHVCLKPPIVLLAPMDNYFQPQPINAALHVSQAKSLKLLLASRSALLATMDVIHAQAQLSAVFATSDSSLTKELAPNALNIALNAT
jgi:hypothetical protein